MPSASPGSTASVTSPRAGAPATPASPVASRVRTPRLLDARLVLGVLLVLVSVVLGARLLSGQDDSVPVLAVTRDLAAGSVLGPGDVVTVSVRLGSGAPAYLDARGASPTGRLLTREVGAGELLPLAALAPVPDVPASRLVTVPVSSLHAPAGDLLPGRRVDVFATYDGSGGRPPTTVAVLRRVVVVGTSGAGSLAGGGADLGVVLRVAPSDAGRLVSALQTARLDLVLVEEGGDPTGGDVGEEVVVPPVAGSPSAPSAGPPTPGEPSASAPAAPAASPTAPAAPAELPATPTEPATAP